MGDWDELSVEARNALLLLAAKGRIAASAARRRGVLESLDHLWRKGLVDRDFVGWIFTSEQYSLSAYGQRLAQQIQPQ